MRAAVSARAADSAPTAGPTGGTTVMGSGGHVGRSGCDVTVVDNASGVPTATDAGMASTDRRFRWEGFGSPSRARRTASSKSEAAKKCTPSALFVVADFMTQCPPAAFTASRADATKAGSSRTNPAGMVSSNDARMASFVSEAIAEPSEGFYRKQSTTKKHGSTRGKRMSPLPDSRNWDTE